MSSRFTKPSEIMVGSRALTGPGFSKRGEIKFIGATKFAPGEWIGISLDTPDGKNDGSVGDQRYFQTEPNHGVFVKRAQVKIDTAPIQVSASTKERLSTLRDARKSPGGSNLDSPKTASRTGISKTSSTDSQASSRKLSMPSRSGDEEEDDDDGGEEEDGSLTPSHASSRGGTPKGGSSSSGKSRPSYLDPIGNLKDKNFNGPQSKSFLKSSARKPLEKETPPGRAPRTPATATPPPQGRTPRAPSTPTGSSREPRSRSTSSSGSGSTKDIATPLPSANKQPVATPSSSRSNSFRERPSLAGGGGLITPQTGRSVRFGGGGDGAESEGDSSSGSSSGSSLIESMQNNIYKLTKDKDELHRTIADLERQLEAANEHLHEANDLTHSLQAREEELEAQLRKRDARIQQFAAAAAAGGTGGGGGSGGGGGGGAAEKCLNCSLLADSIADLTATVEDLTLDKEQLGLEKELLEEKLLQSQVDNEEALAKVEELLSAKARADAAAAHSAGKPLFPPGATAADGINAAAAEIAAMGMGSATQEVTAMLAAAAEAEALTFQLRDENEKLREALRRLNIASTNDKNTLAVLVPRAQAYEEELDVLRAYKAQAEEDLADLRHTVDAASESEHMIESLASKNMELSEAITQCRQTIADLEESQELNEEIDAQQRKQIEENEAVIEMLNNNVAAFERSSDEKDSQILDLRATIHRLKHANKALKEEVRRLNELRSLASLETQHMETRMKELAHLRSNQTLLTDEVRDLYSTNLTVTAQKHKFEAMFARVDAIFGGTLYFADEAKLLNAEVNYVSCVVSGLEAARRMCSVLDVLIEEEGTVWILTPLDGEKRALTSSSSSCYITGGGDDEGDGSTAKQHRDDIYGGGVGGGPAVNISGKFGKAYVVLLQALCTAMNANVKLFGASKSIHDSSNEDDDDDEEEEDPAHPLARFAKHLNPQAVQLMSKLKAMFERVMNAASRAELLCGELARECKVYHQEQNAASLAANVGGGDDDENDFGGGGGGGGDDAEGHREGGNPSATSSASGSGASGPMSADPALTTAFEQIAHDLDDITAQVMHVFAGTQKTSTAGSEADAVAGTEAGASSGGGGGGSEAEVVSFLKNMTILESDALWHQLVERTGDAAFDEHQRQLRSRETMRSSPILYVESLLLSINTLCCLGFQQAMYRENASRRQTGTASSSGNASAVALLFKSLKVDVKSSILNLRANQANFTQQVDEVAGIFKVLASCFELSLSANTVGDSSSSSSSEAALEFNFAETGAQVRLRSVVDSVRKLNSSTGVGFGAPVTLGVSSVMRYHPALLVTGVPGAADAQQMVGLRDQYNQLLEKYWFFVMKPTNDLIAAVHSASSSSSSSSAAAAENGSGGGAGPSTCSGSNVASIEVSWRPRIAEVRRLVNEKLGMGNAATGDASAGVAGSSGVPTSSSSAGAVTASRGLSKSAAAAALALQLDDALRELDIKRDELKVAMRKMQEFQTELDGGGRRRGSFQGSKQEMEKLQAALEAAEQKAQVLQQENRALRTKAGDTSDGPGIGGSPAKRSGRRRFMAGGDYSPLGAGSSSEKNILHALLEGSTGSGSPAASFYGKGSRRASNEGGAGDSSTETLFVQVQASLEEINHWKRLALRRLTSSLLPLDVPPALRAKDGIALSRAGCAPLDLTPAGRSAEAVAMCKAVDEIVDITNADRPRGNGKGDDDGGRGKGLSFSVGDFTRIEFVSLPAVSSSDVQLSGSSSLEHVAASYATLYHRLRLARASNLRVRNLTASIAEFRSHIPKAERHGSLQRIASINSMNTGHSKVLLPRTGSSGSMRAGAAGSAHTAGLERKISSSSLNGTGSSAGVGSTGGIASGAGSDPKERANALRQRLRARNNLIYRISS